eukprot:10991736-Lingulodinium_polyedra.AAC.1
MAGSRCHTHWRLPPAYRNSLRRSACCQRPSARKSSNRRRTLSSRRRPNCRCKRATLMAKPRGLGTHGSWRP